MLYVRPLTIEERVELERMVRQEVGRVSQRAQMILLSARHKGVPEIADVFAVSRATVRFWLKRFNACGPESLYDQPRSGRPPKITAEVKETIEALVRRGPEEQQLQATCWTVTTLVGVLGQRLKQSFSASTLRRVLHELGLRWGRPRLGMPEKTDPEKAAKQWVMVEAIVTAPPEAVILYADESRLHLLPLLRAMWHWVGQQARIPTPGTNITRALLGALNIRSGQWTYLIRDRMCKEDFQAFLEHLLTVYVNVPIILIVDNYSSHTARLIRDWLARQERLQLYYLPKYCSHLNPVEGIWLRLKGRVAANRLYASMSMLLEAVNAFFDAMTRAHALKWAGV
jgi:transposase